MGELSIGASRTAGSPTLREAQKDSDPPPTVRTEAASVQPHPGALQSFPEAEFQT